MSWSTKIQALLFPWLYPVSSQDGTVASIIRLHTDHLVNQGGKVAPGTEVTQDIIGAPGQTQQWNYFAGSGQIHPAGAADWCITGMREGVANVAVCQGGVPSQSWTIVSIPDSAV